MSKKQLYWNCIEACSRDDIKKLPNTIQGVYIMENVFLDVFYIGKTEKQDIRTRIDQHYGPQEENEVIVSEINNNYPICISYAEVNEKDIPGVEQYLKEFFNPKGNSNEPCSEGSIECSLPSRLEEIYSLKFFR